MTNSRKTILTLLLVFTLTNCTDISEIEERLDNLEICVNDLTNAYNALNEAYKSSKMITEVSKNEENNSWIIKFSDNTSIEIKNGKDGANGSDGANGITPLLQIDQNGFWTVSYDNGVSFEKINDSSGNPVQSKGQEGISIRVVSNENGFYCIESYYTSKPDEIIETIETPYTADKANIIQTIEKDNITNIITITMADGNKFKFNYEYKNPTSIAILNSQPLFMETSGVKVVDFRVNPSNAEFKYDVSSNDCEISLDLVGPNTRNYVKEPTNYKLQKVEQVYDENNKLLQGQYKAYIEDLALSTFYNDKVALVLTVKNEKKEEIQISSSAFDIIFSDNDFVNVELLKDKNQGKVLKDVSFTLEGENNYVLSTPYVSNCTGLKPSFTSNGKVYVNGIEQVSGRSTVDLSEPITYTVVSDKGESKTYTISLEYSGLPVVEINTPDNAPITSKEDWLENSTMRIINTDGSEDYYGVMNIRGRGNNTWYYPKKPYAIKLESKAEILKMPKHKRWVLLANWMDRTLLRNNIAFQIGWSTGLA